ncbi:hypothetical protein [Candidatus Ruminimicrobiellum ovillum]|uniref:hypothetical protein n=1 Tax=Candidatus Ruminimicrobiellum ovillum TaxID=1947927 RepID=UPI003559D536
MKKIIHNFFYCIELVLIAVIYLTFAKEQINFTPYVTYPLAILCAFLPVGILAAIAFVVCSFFYNINAIVVNLSYLFIGIYLLGIWLTSLCKEKKYD